MSNPLRTPEDYELFLYTLAEQFPFIRRSTLLSFTQPNLPVLIREILTLLHQGAAGNE